MFICLQSLPVHGMMNCKLWSVGAMNSVIIAWIILHNMIIEDEWETENTNEYLFDNIQDGFLVENMKS